MVRSGWMKKTLSGHEAIARGAFEARVKVAAVYPGTPSTEILETIAQEYKEIYAEWSPRWRKESKDQFRQLTMNNGLKVVLKESHTAPVVALPIGVKIGSADG